MHLRFFGLAYCGSHSDKQAVNALKAIDVHAHIFPPKIEHIATDAIRDFYNRGSMRHSGSSEELLASGRPAGVVKYLVFTTATTPHQVTVIHDFIMGEARKHPEFIPVGTMHKDFEDKAAELDRIYDMGMRGIKLHPDFQKFCIDDDKMMPVFEHLQKKGMFVITHSGDYRYDFSHPARVARIAKLFPEMPLIAAHFGGWSQWDIARELLVLPNVYVDTSSTFGFGGVEPVIQGLRTFDPTHIFFGDDFPMWDHAEEIRRLREVVTDDAFLEDILYNNFMAFFSRYGASAAGAEK